MNRPLVVVRNTFTDFLAQFKCAGAKNIIIPNLSEERIDSLTNYHTIYICL